MRAPASERILRIRERLGYSQRELAHELNVSSGAVALWEKGSRRVPGPVLKILDFYEQQLGIGDPKSGNSTLEAMRKLTSDWGTKLGLSPELRSALRRSVETYLNESLASAEPVRQRVKLALARRTARHLADAKGLPMKVAQLASYLDPGIPEPLREVLGHAVAQSRPKREGVISKVVCEELGQHPCRHFAEWSPKPLAVASIGQVHLARLRSGERVAVKIQYPGIRRGLERYFLAFPLLNFLLSLVPKEEHAIFEEVKEAILAECDYVHEAELQERFRAVFEGEDGISVPRVFRELSSQRVLTTALAEGVSLREFAATATQEQRNRAGEAIARFHSVAIFKHGLIHADPHPANYVFAPDKVHFLDFGRTSSYDANELSQLKRLYRGILGRDATIARKMLQERDLVRNWAAFDFDGFWNLLQTQHRHHLFEGEFQFTPQYVDEIASATRRFPQKQLLRLTRDSLWSLCINASICSVLAELGAKSDWRAAALEVLG